MNHLKYIIISIALNFLMLAQVVDESWKIYDDSEVARIEITINPSALSWMYSNVQSDSVHPITIRFKNKWIDQTIQSAGMRLRGNTSRDSQKKSFKILFDAFQNDFVFFGVKNLNLNGEHNDPSIIRSKICWDIFRMIDVPSSRAAHCAVYINGRYYGLYISIEDYGLQHLKRNFSNPEGNLWRCLYPADLAWRGSDPNSYKHFENGRQVYDLQTNENEDDYFSLARFIRIINQTAAASLFDSLDNFVEMKDVLKYFAVNNLTGSWDDYWFLKNNYFLYHEPGNDKINWIPYDYDNTFGIDWFSKDWATINPYTFAKIDNSPRPFVEKLFTIPEYKNLYTHFLSFYNDKIFNLNFLEERIESLRVMITPFAIADTFRTLDYGFDAGDFFNSYSSTGFSNQHVKRGLKEFINVRHNSLPQQLGYAFSKAIVYDINFTPRNPSATDSIKVYASIFSPFGIESATIEFTPGVLPVTQSYTMRYIPNFASNSVEENDLWVGTILPLGENGSGAFRIKVIDSLGQTIYFPRVKQKRIDVKNSLSNILFINEFLAANTFTNPDPHGEFDDWIELYNSGTTPIKLSGKYLTDKRTNLTKWKFPNDDIYIQPNSWMIVWCDEDSGQIGLHTNFKLSAAGEFIALVDSTGNSIIDSISFGQQSNDVAFARIPDGSENWRFTSTPTPEAMNVLTKVDEDIIPQNFSLHVFPNPFNPATKIKFSIPAGGETHRGVSLRVFDILGREVATLVENELTAGNYEISFDANKYQLTSGVYFVRLTHGQKSLARKIMLVR